MFHKAKYAILALLAFSAQAFAQYSVLGQLGVSGVTDTGGASKTNMLVKTDANGMIDSSLVGDLPALGLLGWVFVDPENSGADDETFDVSAGSILHPVKTLNHAISVLDGRDIIDGKIFLVSNSGAETINSLGSISNLTISGSGNVIQGISGILPDAKLTLDNVIVENFSTANEQNSIGKAVVYLRHGAAIRNISSTETSVKIYTDGEIPKYDTDEVTYPGVECYSLIDADAINYTADASTWWWSDIAGSTTTTSNALDVAAGMIPRPDGIHASSLLLAWDEQQGRWHWSGILDLYKPWSYITNYIQSQGFLTGTATNDYRTWTFISNYLDETFPKSAGLDVRYMPRTEITRQLDNYAQISMLEQNYEKKSDLVSDLLDSSAFDNNVVLESELASKIRNSPDAGAVATNAAKNVIDLTISSEDGAYDYLHDSLTNMIVELIESHGESSDLLYPTDIKSYPPSSGYTYLTRDLFGAKTIVDNFETIADATTMSNHFQSAIDNIPTDSSFSALTNRVRVLEIWKSDGTEYLPTTYSGGRYLVSPYVEFEHAIADDFSITHSLLTPSYIVSKLNPIPYNEEIAGDDSYAGLGVHAVEDGSAPDVFLSSGEGSALRLYGNEVSIDSPTITLNGSIGAMSIGTRADGSDVGAYSVAHGDDVIASGDYSYAGGVNTTAYEEGSHAEGSGASAYGMFSHAEGDGVSAYGMFSHAEGRTNVYSGTARIIRVDGGQQIGDVTYSYKFEPFPRLPILVENGRMSYFRSNCWFLIFTNRQTAPFIVSQVAYYGPDVYFSTTEDMSSIQTSYKPIYWDVEAGIAANVGAHSEGLATTAAGDYSHAEGACTLASGPESHAEGINATASGYYSHAEGTNTLAGGIASHAEGGYSYATDEYTHAEGYGTSANASRAHAEGNDTAAEGYASHAEGADTAAEGYASHAEGSSTGAAGDYSHAEGADTVANGRASHAEGTETSASGAAAHAEGTNTLAGGIASHAEGVNTAAGGYASHASGVDTSASGYSALASGYGSSAAGRYASAHGFYSISDDEGSFVWSAPEYEIVADYLLEDSTAFNPGADYIVPDGITFAELFGLDSDVLENLDSLHYDGEQTEEYKFDQVSEWHYYLDGTLQGTTCNDDPVPERVLNGDFSVSLIDPENDAPAISFPAIPKDDIPEYNSHGRGSFSANPEGGTTNFWVGATNLRQHILNEAAGVMLPKTWTNSAQLPRLALIDTNQYATYPTTASGAGAFAAGRSVSVSGTGAAGFGSQSTANGFAAFASGDGANATADRAFARGRGVTASGDNAIAMGISAISTRLNSFVWSGIFSSQPYACPTEGAFAINPEGGITNVFIGTNSLQQHISNETAALAARVAELEAQQSVYWCTIQGNSWPSSENIVLSTNFPARRCGIIVREQSNDHLWLQLPHCEPEHRQVVEFLFDVADGVSSRDTRVYLGDVGVSPSPLTNKGGRYHFIFEWDPVERIWLPYVESVSGYIFPKHKDRSTGNVYNKFPHENTLWP